MLQGRMRWLLMVNPVSGIIENFRTALFGQLTGREFDWSALGISALLTVAILFYSAYSFRRMERTFADIV
jgi:ABC-type polysaccharide/polyol phosphate export permease